MRVAIRVKPGASRTAVGGRYSDGSSLIVAVTAPAVDGKATEAALRAVAEAFGVRRSKVSLVSGERSREKVLEVDGDPAGLEARRAALLGDPT